jgi:hypothetical protein
VAQEEDPADKEDGQAHSAMIQTISTKETTTVPAIHSNPAKNDPTRNSIQTSTQKPNSSSSPPLNHLLHNEYI